MSEKRRALLPARQAVVDAALLRDGYRCQAREAVPQVRCGGPLDAHELIPRSVWSAGWLDLTNIVIVCRSHHRWVSANPDAAHAVGLHRFSWEREPTS